MVGARIKEYLQEHGIKQTFLAEKIDMTNSVVSDMLTGQRKISCVEYYKICTVLGLPLDTFLKDETD